MSMVTAASTGLPVKAPPQPINSLLLITMLLMMLGLLMMTSASVEIANSQFGDPLYYFKRQTIFALMGVAALLVTLNIPMRTWRRASWLLLMGSYLLLLVVLVPGIGKVVNGSARWLDLGLFNLQPSELAKVFAVIYLAAYLQRQEQQVKDSWSGFLKPMLVIGAAVILLHFEPDHGAMVILMLTAFCMIFLAGARLYRFVLLLALCIAAITWLAISKPYVVTRFSSFLNPWADENVYAGGYQLTQALIAFGRGEWFGVGLGNSIQKLYFLPEAHNDFVLAIIGEELGLFGVCLVILLFCLLVYKAFRIGRLAQDLGNLFNAYCAFGIALLFAGQAMINVGVNVGLLPTKGLTLPFLSYGGASLIVSFYMVALLLRIQYESENFVHGEDGHAVR